MNKSGTVAGLVRVRAAAPKVRDSIAQGAALGCDRAEECQPQRGAIPLAPNDKAPTGAGPRRHCGLPFNALAMRLRGCRQWRPVGAFGWWGLANPGLRWAKECGPVGARGLRPRRGFTLVELLVAITIIGILSAMALGGMYRANVAARQTNSKITVNKVAIQINEIWESYRTRKLPIDPKQVLASGGAFPYTVQYTYAVGNGTTIPGWLVYFSAFRSIPGDPLLAAPGAIGAGGQPLFANNIQIAALRLAATRELMRLELPSSFNDFLTPVATNPPNPNPAANSNPVRTLLIPQPMNGNTPLANPGGLSEQYRQFFIAHATVYNEQYQNAECLYMIIKFASQNDVGQKSITDDPRLVGDVDGDGMPEIQDAFLAEMFTPGQAGSPYTQHNNPIGFLRWPAGFYSDLQPGPTSSQTQADYAAARHDIFDPLRIDPRAFSLTPLVYSAGADGSYGLVDGKNIASPSIAQIYQMNDPYWSDNNNPLLGTQMDFNTPSPAKGTGAYLDNITNHLLSARSE